MKFTNLLKCFFCFFIAFHLQMVYSQNLTGKTLSINVTNASLSTVLTTIEKQSNYLFVYEDKIIDVKRLVTLNLKKASIEDVLTALFLNTDIVYTFVKNNIVLKKQTSSKNKNPKDQVKQKITGVVVDEKGQPVIGANVIVPGSNIGSVTDLNGHFSIETESGSFIRVSYIGYNTKEFEVTPGKDLKLQLEPGSQQLNELVITAQAIGQKNAILQQVNSSTIKNVVAADRLQENPDANAVEAIGRLPGISVSRNGGEGVGLIIRGLQPQYTAVTLNGVALPGSGGGGRDVNISGFSQYALQGVEVYKSLTADMEANGVAGSVNLKLREAPEGFRSNIMAQLGYNNMNNYWGNYKTSGEFSNRFFNNKLGLFFVASSEQVNRSTQTMSAGYTSLSGTTNDLGLTGVNLNNISNTKTRRSAMVSLDFKLTPSTTLNLYGLYNYARNNNQSQSKSYNVNPLNSNPSIGIGMSYNPEYTENVYQIALSGLTKLKKSKLELDYGIALSSSNSNNPMSRGWSASYYPLNSSLATQLTVENSKLSPEDAIKPYTSQSLSDANTRFNNMSQASSTMNDRNLTSYFNIKIPYSIGDKVTAYLKFGGTYRNKTRYQDVQSGNMTLSTNIFATKILQDSLSWLKSNNQLLSLDGMKDKDISGFLNGKFNYGSYYDFKKLNQMTDMWNKASDYWYPKGQNVWGPMFGGNGRIGWNQDILGCMINDQDIDEEYFAGYLMTEMNFSKYLMFLPGLRFEKTVATMSGFSAVQPTIADPLYVPLPGSTTEATRSDNFWLPMIHLRIKPSKLYYIHLAYTQTLGRPGFDQISPIEFRNTGFQPFQYTAKNPLLKTELWTNYDAQFTVYDKKLGLLSITGFYKTVKDKIGSLSYSRIKGDPIVSPFPDASVVQMNIIKNFQYPIYLKGIEIELQTSFWYLPKPFKYMTFTINGTYTDSKTEYPYSYIINKVPATGGRPVPTRIDSTRSGVMLQQPRYLLNTSLGYNRKGLNVWLSYQYNGNIQTGIGSFSSDIYDGMKDSFSRLDLQISQRLSGKLTGLEFLLNIANLTNFTEVQHMRYDSRATYMESYGWTADFGVRYRF